MSTKSTIKYFWNETLDSGYHLYAEAFTDEIFLQVEGEAISGRMTTDGKVVTIGMPRQWAIDLGLLPEGTVSEYEPDNDM